MATIFLSYSRDDRQTAERVARLLEERGFSVFWDAEIPAADRWREHIEKEIRAAKIFVLLVSATSVQKAYVLGEVEIAVQTKRRIIPVTIDGTLGPLDVRALQHLDWRELASADVLGRRVKTIIRNHWLRAAAIATIIAAAIAIGVFFLKPKPQPTHVDADVTIATFDDRRTGAFAAVEPRLRESLRNAARYLNPAPTIEIDETVVKTADGAAALAIATKAKIVVWGWVDDAGLGMEIPRCFAEIG